MDSKAALKLRNKKKILSSVRENKEISKRDLQRISNLSWSTVSMLTTELIDEKYLSVCGKQNLGVGRCPEMLSVNKKSHLIIGVDINMAFVCVAIADLSGELLSKKSFPHVKTYDEVMTHVTSTIDAMMRFYGRDNIAALAFSIQGHVDINSGVSTCIYDIENWRDVPVKQIFEEKYSLPVTVIHDTFAVMKAESVLGNTVKNSSNALLIFYSERIGISASFMTNGEIYIGYNGTSGEIGLMLVPSFKSGDPVVLEKHITGGGILSEFRNDNPESGINTLEELVSAAENGNESAAEAFAVTGKRIGVAVSNCVNMLNPQVVVIKGIDGVYSRNFKEELLSAVDRYSKNSNSKIIISGNNEDLTVIGAVLTAVQQILDKI